MWLLLTSQGGTHAGKEAREAEQNTPLAYWTVFLLLAPPLLTLCISLPSTSWTRMALQ